MSKRFQKSNRRVVASILSLLMVMQQSALSVMASNITNWNGDAMMKNPQTGAYHITPDMVNEALRTGFRKFRDFNLSAGDIANFLMMARNSDAWVDGNHSNHQYSEAAINTFVAAVQNQVRIDGIVNTLQDVGGTVGGNLIFISPNGMVVGSSGVLNVGSLSVITPQDNDAFKNFTDQITSAPLTDGENTYYEGGSLLTVDALNDLTVDGNQSVNIQGRIAATNDININTGNFTAGADSIIVTSAGNNNITTDMINYGLASNAEADTLFNALVNSRTTSGNGNLTIQTVNGFDGQAGSQIINLGAGNIRITNTETAGINAAGSIENTNGLLEAINSGADGINISGEIENTGTTNITNNASATNGIKLASSGRINNHGSSLNITNDATGGIDLQGVITGDRRATVNIISNDSTITMGDMSTSNKNANNIIADGDVTIKVTNGNKSYRNI